MIFAVLTVLTAAQTAPPAAVGPRREGPPIMSPLVAETIPMGGATDAEKSVRALERAWLDAYEDRDEAAMDRIVAEDFVLINPDGRRRTKAGVIRQIVRARANPSATVRFCTHDVLSRAFGDTVVLNGVVVMERTRDGQVVRSANLYTDTYVRTGGRWQVAASQLADRAVGEGQACPPRR